MPRSGQAPAKLNRSEFHEEFQKSFADPSFIPVKNALEDIEEVAWKNYHDGGHKAPLTEKAGPQYFDPDYELSIEWKKTSERLAQAELTQKNANTRSRVLLICSSARNDGSCPGEISKTWRLTLIAQEALQKINMGRGAWCDYSDTGVLVSSSRCFKTDD